MLEPAAFCNGTVQSGYRLSLKQKHIRYKIITFLMSHSRPVKKKKRNLYFSLTTEVQYVGH